MPSNILSAQLPSDDEADDDYDPTIDKTAEKEDLVQQEKPGQAKPKRKRGVLLHGDASADEQEEEDEPDIPTDPISLAKRRKAMAAWEALNGGKSTTKSAPEVADETPAAAPNAAPSSTQPPAKPLSLAALCKPAPKKNAKSRADQMWMKQLGLCKPKAPAAPTSNAETASCSSAPDTSAPSCSAPDTKAPSSSAPDTKSVAAQALQAAKAATLLPSQQNKVTVVETRRFAGKDITLEQVVDADSKLAKKAATQPAAGSSGLDAVLQSITGAKKVNVLDKSRHDWSGFKREHADVEEELEGYKKSNDKYLDKVDFLKRAELREYEAERDKRLASDIRTRGRT